MASGAFFLQRLNDHVRYLNSIDGVLNGRKEFQDCDHLSCKLGAWLYGPGREEVSACGDEAVQLFERIFAPHEAFHTASHTALELKAAGKDEEAKKAVTDMHTLSVQLVNLLIALDKQATNCK